MEGRKTSAKNTEGFCSYHVEDWRVKSVRIPIPVVRYCEDCVVRLLNGTFPSFTDMV